jgi:hypothetical protein
MKAWESRILFLRLLERQLNDLSILELQMG